MKPGLSLRVSQQLALTPQLQQSIRLLQLSTLELAGEVEQMLADNPFLEREDEAAPREEFGLAQADARVSAGDRADENAIDSGAAGADPAGADGDFEPESLAPDDWDGDGSADIAPDDGEWGGEAPARTGSPDGDETDPGERAGGQPSLAEHLLHQALTLRLSPEDAAALRFLIGSLNDDGYLEDSLAQLAATLTDADDELEQMQELVHRLTLALRLLQSLEPAGVGARHLAECLTLQLKSRQAERALPPPEQARIATALRICARHDAVELLARRDIRKLAQLVGESEDAVRAATALIGRLDPKPGRRFVDVERQVIVPDVIVSAVGGAAQPRFRVALNPEVMPRLRVHELYASALRGSDRHPALAERLQEARWFIRNIQQRFDTILRVASAIVERQRGFFLHGELAMRPMIQRELADELGVHESTISRVTTAKYMATPRGTFELKYFFGSALGTESGTSASSTAVRALIKQFIEAEDAARPLSDAGIAELLKAQGIDCARRTVAKYREALRIPTAQLRKGA
ncbi:MAG TPA: RNA polymerase factor sigma-54 [Ottowia sp.]|nr:RNA polymerase factor sigma-54 [Ottowia sp.]HMT58179.1 RNA polymerase factor sigma-54 [Ottowia sp.]HMT84635.1 RNA polymerase factor sigma-54 [Ottowia sp.]HOK11668.1 RNA polymerase factor sigma-54 [Ottowia sp.]HOM21566.1 RNA polymerase factor sigma-54 [Ottowia sp.]